jgi:hypothetical protein
VVKSSKDIICMTGKVQKTEDFIKTLQWIPSIVTLTGSFNGSNTFGDVLNTW